MMPHADHAQACAIRARNLRHDAIADLCAAIYQEAGHVAHRETDVPGILTRNKKEPIRADVLVRARAPGSWECAEVKVRHCFNSDGDLVISRATDMDELLRAEEARAHVHYRPVRVRPWVMTTRAVQGRDCALICGDWLGCVCSVGTYATRSRCPRSCNTFSTGGAQSCRARLCWATQMSFWQRCRGSRRGAGSRPPAETQVYDLQSLRMTF